MANTTTTESFRAFFNETSDPADACEHLVQGAIDNAPCLTLDGELDTIASDYGNVENITVDFAVTVEPADDDRSPRGRLLEYLMGDTSCDGLAPR